MAALVAAYLANPEFVALELSTRTNQMRYPDTIVTEIGERGVKGLRPPCTSTSCAIGCPEGSQRPTRS